MELIIRSEADAFNYLKSTLLDAGGRARSELPTLHFDGWPRLVIHIDGPRYDQTITPTLMKGLLNLQSAIYRSYALSRYGSPEITRLSREERRQLEIVVKVGPGSSLFEVDLQALLMKLIEMVGGKMEPQHLTTIIVSMGIIWGAQSMYRSYLQTRKEIREREIDSGDRKAHLESMEFMSEQETERMKVLQEIVRRDPLVDSLERFGFDAKTQLIKSIARSDANAVSLQGVELTPDDADELVKNARLRATELRLDGVYRIHKVDSSSPNGFKLAVINTETKARLTAVVQDSALDAKAKDILKEAEWDKRDVYLEINAKVNGNNDFKEVVILSVRRHLADQPPSGLVEHHSPE